MDRTLTGRSDRSVKRVRELRRRHLHVRRPTRRLQRVHQLVVVTKHRVRSPARCAQRTVLPDNDLLHGRRRLRKRNRFRRNTLDTAGSGSIARLAEHHLVPKSRKGKETVRICNDCHRQLHVLFDVKTLEKTLNTIELLKQDERIQRWIGFIGKRSSISRLKMRRGR